MTIIEINHLIVAIFVSASILGATSGLLLALFSRKP